MTKLQICNEYDKSINLQGIVIETKDEDKNIPENIALQYELQTAYNEIAIMKNQINDLNNLVDTNKQREFFFFKSNNIENNVEKIEEPYKLNHKEDNVNFIKEINEENLSEKLARLTLLYSKVLDNNSLLVTNLRDLTVRISIGKNQNW